MPTPTAQEVEALTKTFKRRVRGEEYSAYTYTKPSRRAGKNGWENCDAVWVALCVNGTELALLWAESLERVQAHWEGFLVAQKALAPKEGQHVYVANAPDRRYTGKVVRVTASRALVSYKFHNGRRAADRWYKLSEISWW